MRTNPRTIVTLLSMALPLLGCSSEPGGDAAQPGDTIQPGASNPGGGPTAVPTFHKDVEPILQQHCQSCHTPGQIAPFSLISYSDAKGVAPLLVERTKDRSMPPWSPKETEECKPRFGWKHDRRLSDAELATLEAWNNAGAPEGDPKDAPPPVDAAALDKLSRVDVTVAPQKAFVSSGDKDQFICFVLDPKITQDTFISASRLVPGNMKVDHHAVVYVDPASESTALANADGYYDCFSGPGIKQLQVLAPWVPGALPAVYPPEAGMPIKAGSKLVLQMHYHPAGTTADPDLTKIELQLYTGTPKYRASITAVANFPLQFANGDGLQPGLNDDGQPAFLIPAGVKGHTESMRLTMSTQAGGQPTPEAKIYDVMPHMHYIGTEMKMSLHRPAPQNGEPADECLIQSDWDFNWQQAYAYNVPIDDLPTLRGGDVLDVRCTYDNTLDNPFLKRALMEAKLTEPMDVHLGESTLDEMCVGILTVLVKL